jgi:hypothetical protein
MAASVKHASPSDPITDCGIGRQNTPGMHRLAAMAAIT